MKRKEKDELKTKETKELENILSQARKTVSSLRIEKAQYKLKNTRAIFLKRKEIALIKSILKEKELANKK